MEQAIVQWLLQYTMPLVATEVQKLAAGAVEALPGMVSVLAKDLLAQPQFQAEIAALEKMGLEGIAQQGLGVLSSIKTKIVAYVEEHVHGYSQVPGGDSSPSTNVLKLSSAEVVALLKLQASGGLDKLLGIV